jgi:Ca2+-dependent lipid-binding protein
MNIVFGILSTEQGVHLPDAKVTVSRVALAGRFRSDFELLSDFPFIGNSTVGFHSLPVQYFLTLTFRYQEK